MIASVITALWVSAFSIFDWQPEEIRLSCYLPTGHRTYSGQVPYVGGLACNKEHLGQTAMLFDSEYRFIGYFECNDIGGNSLLRQGKAVDIFQETMEDARTFIRENGDHGFVVWLEADG